MIVSPPLTTSADERAIGVGSRRSVPSCRVWPGPETANWRTPTTSALAVYAVVLCHQGTLTTRLPSDHCGRPGQYPGSLRRLSVLVAPVTRFTTSTPP